MFECCHFMHIMVMVDCFIDSYFWICVSLCSIALSPFCCTCLIVHFSIDGGFVWVWPVLSLYLCIKISGLHSYLHLIMLIFILCGAVLVLCYEPILLQMSRRSSKGKDIVAEDPATPVAKRTWLSSQSSQDSNLERFRTPLTSHIYSNIFDKSTPIVERVVEFNTLGTTFISRIFESRD